MRVTFIALDLLRFPGGGMGQVACTQRPREPTCLADLAFVPPPRFRLVGVRPTLEPAVPGPVRLPLRQRGSVLGARTRERSQPTTGRASTASACRPGPS